ncbi:YvrJ family protein [Priestia aryabhattai]|uniref:YvrJ family protein n=1 Tax=Priestia aryabhattai TaxID=412384 RepID=UPI0008DDDE59|nr:YvrJ family protein [Priestia aryabhattai]OHY73348.1 YvrJ family protein [Priestia aryabhattai]
METVTLPVLISAVGNFGFPVILSLYLLIRFEKKIGDLTLAIQSLNEAANKVET